MSEERQKINVDEQALEEAGKSLQVYLRALPDEQARRGAFVAIATYLGTKAEKAQAENERLREALGEAQTVLESFIRGVWLSGGNREHADLALKLIRRALASNTEAARQS